MNVPYKQLVTTNTVKLTSKLCKIDVSGYSFDNYKTLNLEGYTILCQFGEASDGLSFFPSTSKLVLNSNQQNKLINNFEQLIPNIAESLSIPEEAACQRSIDFFSDKQVSVLPTGIQGRCYHLMKSVQNLAPMSYTSEIVAILKTNGMNGFQVVVQAPLTFVGASYIGALFFSYCGSLAGNTTAGLIFNGTSYVLSSPMRGLEITLNGILLRPLSNFIGLPLILNGTQEMLKGQGIPIKEYTKIELAFEKINNSTLLKKAKEIYKIIRRKD